MDIKERIARGAGARAESLIAACANARSGT